MLRCPECGLAHFPDEVHRESERGVAYNARLARARGALAGDARPARPAQLEQPASTLPIQPQPRLKARGKGGRPAGPKPWKDRLREHRRAYMRGWRARRKATPAP